MQSSLAWLLFLLFGAILFVMYVAIRRRWISPILAAAAGVLASIIVMTLTGLAQGNILLHAIFTGLLVGGLFSGGTLAMAFYFQRQEGRNPRRSYEPPDDGASG